MNNKIWKRRVSYRKDGEREKAREYENKKRQNMYELNID